MLQKLSHVTLFVKNQEEAKDFYVNKLGFKVHTDHTMDNGFRWLAVMAPQQISRTRYEIRRKPRLDIVGDFLGGTVFGVAQPALAREALLLTRDIVRYPCEGLTCDNDSSGREFGQGIRAVDAVVVDVRPCRIDVDDDLQLRCRQLNVQAMSR